MEGTMKWLTIILTFLLIGTNVYWLNQNIDTAITGKYSEQQIYELQNAFREAILLMPKIKPKFQKNEIVTEAEQISASKAFEKDGCVWVGFLGLKFNDKDQLVHVSPAWNYGEADLCFPKN